MCSQNYYNFEKTSHPTINFLNTLINEASWITKTGSFFSINNYNKVLADFPKFKWV